MVGEKIACAAPSRPSPFCHKERVGTPMFFLHEPHFDDAVTAEAARRHPSRTQLLDEATVVIVGVPSQVHLDRFQALPRRTAERPYLVNLHGMSCEWTPWDTAKL